jgi:hypothetical protein
MPQFSSCFDYGSPLFAAPEPFDLLQKPKTCGSIAKIFFIPLDTFVALSRTTALDLRNETAFAFQVATPLLCLSNCPSDGLDQTALLASWSGFCEIV